MLSSLFGSPSCPIGNRSNCSRLQGNWRMKTRRSSILVWWVANATATLNRLNSSVHKLVKFDMWPHLCSSWKSLCGLWAPMRERKVGSLIFSYPVHFDNFHQSWKSKKLFSCFGLRRVAENELIEKTSKPSALRKVSGFHSEKSSTTILVSTWLSFHPPGCCLLFNLSFSDSEMRVPKVFEKM